MKSDFRISELPTFCFLGTFCISTFRFIGKLVGKNSEKPDNSVNRENPTFCWGPDKFVRLSDA